MNVVMNDGGGFIELQGTAEGHAFRREELDALLALAGKGVGRTAARSSATPWRDDAMPMKLVLASGNRGKLAEMRELLRRQRPRAGRTGRAWRRRCRSKTGGNLRRERADQGAPCLRALTGLPALGRRFRPLRRRTGRRARPVLGALRRRARRQRGQHRASCWTRLQARARARSARAHFYCVIVLLRHADDPQPLIAEGVWHGRILDAPRGNGGFGYDPVFFDPALRRQRGRTATRTQEPHQPSRPGAGAAARTAAPAAA